MSSKQKASTWLEARSTNDCESPIEHRAPHARSCCVCAGKDFLPHGKQNLLLSCKNGLQTTFWPVLLNLGVFTSLIINVRLITVTLCWWAGGGDAIKVTAEHTSPSCTSPSTFNVSLNLLLWWFFNGISVDNIDPLAGSEVVQTDRFAHRAPVVHQWSGRGLLCPANHFWSMLELLLPTPASALSIILRPSCPADSLD